MVLGVAYLIFFFWVNGLNCWDKRRPCLHLFISCWRRALWSMSVLTTSWSLFFIRDGRRISRRWRLMKCKVTVIVWFLVFWVALSVAIYPKFIPWSLELIRSKSFCRSTFEGDIGWLCGWEFWTPNSVYCFYYFWTDRLELLPYFIGITWWSVNIYIVCL